MPGAGLISVCPSYGGRLPSFGVVHIWDDGESAHFEDYETEAEALRAALARARKTGAVFQ
jgi:hypothetical protein